LPNAVLYCFDYFTGESWEFVAGRGLVIRCGAHDYFFEEDGNALNGLVAEGSLGCGELKGVANFVGEVGRL
jgi:hypothetical protein